jgi:purine-binding chemotaxis protein CheW
MLSITSDKAFTKAKDHHDCAFGKWYYQFETSNKSMEMLVKRFREPHKKIHALADLALNLKAENRQSDAIRLINDAKSTTLKQLFNVFDLVKAQYEETNRALAVIVKTGDYRVGFLVDSVHSVERFNESQRDSMEESEFHSAISSYADSLYKKDENIYYSLIPEKVIVEAMAVELQEA